jgi:2-polyprenyl-3-methyl-5-hydroxy-6-metoxy-1,4-benzoquinol methylase
MARSDARAQPVKVAREGARWEEIANQDPMWAILSYREGKYGGWSETEFFRHGADRVEEFLTCGAAVHRPLRHRTALDFGCGVGRLARALAARFEHVTGLDISETMVQRARELNAGIENIEFRCNDRPDLSLFADESFDLVACDIVLQHLPDREAVFGYLAEFVRVLNPDGLLVFQLPTSLPLAVRIQPRRSAYRLMRRVGLPARTLYWRLGLHPNRMLAVPSAQVISWMESRGAKVLDVADARSRAVAAVRENVYYMTR